MEYGFSQFFPVQTSCTGKLIRADDLGAQYQYSDKEPNFYTQTTAFAAQIAAALASRAPDLLRCWITTPLLWPDRLNKLNGYPNSAAVTNAYKSAEYE